MSAKVTSLRVPTPGTFLGKFQFRRFNVLNAQDISDYEKLRTEANDPRNGITIENIRDLKEVEETRTPEGDMTRIERMYIIVQWWVNDKKPKGKKPNDEQGYYLEKPAGGQE